VTVPTPPAEQFIADSPLEGMGFELSFPDGIGPFATTRTGFQRETCRKSVTTLARNRKFESSSLPRRVNCEPDFRGASYRAVYGWFTEGFETPDLKEAKALLDELA
jgi:hypothetical protein